MDSDASSATQSSDSSLDLGLQPNFVPVRVLPFYYHQLRLEQCLIVAGFPNLLLFNDLPGLLGTRRWGATVLLCLGNSTDIICLVQCSRDNHFCLCDHLFLEA